MDRSALAELCLPNPQCKQCFSLDVGDGKKVTYHWLSHDLIEKDNIPIFGEPSLGEALQNMKGWMSVNKRKKMTQGEKLDHLMKQQDALLKLVVQQTQIMGYFQSQLQD